MKIRGSEDQPRDDDGRFGSGGGGSESGDKELDENNVPSGVLLIGIDDRHPLTIMEGNHRMMAAMLSMPESAHRRFRFYCGFSPRMDSCCWHKTDLHSVVRFVQHTIWYVLHDANFIVARGLRQAR